MSHTTDFAVYMAQEIFEQEFRRGLTGGINRAITRGLTGTDAVKAVLNSVYRTNGKFMKDAMRAGGFAVPLLGKACAALLASSPFLDSIMPGDNRPVVKQVRKALKILSTSFLIGATEAIGDIGDQINAMVDKLDPNELIKQDAVAAVATFAAVGCKKYFGDDVFFPERNPDNSIKMGDDGLPVVKNTVWNAVVSAWKADKASGSSRKRGGPAPANFPWEEITFETLVTKAMVGKVSIEDLERIAAIRNQSQPAAVSSYAKITPDAIAVVKALAATITTLNPMEYDAAEDLIQDPFEPSEDGKPFDPAKVNLLGQYKAQIQTDGKFTKDDFWTVVAFIDIALGGKRTWPNRARRMLTQFRLQVGMNGLKDASKWLWGQARWLFVLILIPMLAFLLCFFIAGLGTFRCVLQIEVAFQSNIWSTAVIGLVLFFWIEHILRDFWPSKDNRWYKPIRSLFKTGLVVCTIMTLVKSVHVTLADDHTEILIQSTLFVLVGTWGMYIILTLLKFADVMLRPLARWIGFSQDAFTITGRKIAALIGTYGSLMAALHLSMLGVKSFGYIHYWVLTIASLMYTGVMLLQACGFFGETRLWGLQAATWLKKLATGFTITIFLVATYIGLPKIGVDPFSWIHSKWEQLLAYILMNPLAASIGLFLLFWVLVFIGLKLTERMRSSFRGDTMYVPKLGATEKFVLFIVSLLIASLPWKPYSHWPKAEAETVKTTEVVKPAIEAKESARSLLESKPTPVERSVSEPRITPEPAPMIVPKSIGTKKRVFSCAELPPAVRRMDRRCAL